MMAFQNAIQHVFRLTSIMVTGWATVIITIRVSCVLPTVLEVTVHTIALTVSNRSFHIMDPKVTVHTIALAGSKTSFPMIALMDPNL